MDTYRDYSAADNKVRDTYRKGRINQTVEFVKRMKSQYERFEIEMSIWDAFELIDKFVDASDPDCTVSNMNHLIQTAEGIRQAGEPDWMQLVGLIHDLGKVMYMFGNDKDGTSIDEQWAVVGDTFITGCNIPDVCVYSEFNCLNPDMMDMRYNTKYGMYKEGCGLDNCLVSYGHDEYFYQVLRNYQRENPGQFALPNEAMYIIRYHSLYPWHRYGEYTHLESDRDKRMKPLVQRFQGYDLYTKENVGYTWDDYKKYYNGLIKKYLGCGMIKW